MLNGILLEAKAKKKEKGRKIKAGKNSVL